MRLLEKWRVRRARKYYEEYVNLVSWKDDTGQRLFFIHEDENCEGRGCSIHHPSDHHMKDWPRHYRFDRQLMERICEHGVGHPDPDDIRYQYEVLGASQTISVHGCCGCCKPPAPKLKPLSTQQLAGLEAYAPGADSTQPIYDRDPGDEDPGS